jgi:hypothetical protein
VELKNAQKRLSHLQWITCLVIIGGMRSIPTSALEVMVMLPHLQLFINQEAKQAANRLVGNECSYVLNFGHSEVLIKMTCEMSVLLAPRDKYVSLIYSIGNRMPCLPKLKYSVEIFFTNRVRLVWVPGHCNGIH